MAEPIPRLAMCSSSKSIPGMKALDEVPLPAWSGEVLALMGGNGAGQLH